MLPAQRGLQTGSVRAAHSEFRTVAHQHRIIATPQGTNLANVVQVYNSRAMDAHETVWIEVFRQCRHRLAQHVAFLTDMEFCVITLRLDPFDQSLAQKYDSRSGLDQDSLTVPGFSLNLLQSCLQFQFMVYAIQACSSLVKPVQRFREAGLVEGL